MPTRIPKVPTESADKILATTAELAAGSPNLSASERTELKKLAAKARKGGKAGLGTTDRVRIVLLIRKAGPGTLPHEVPPWLRRLLGKRSPTTKEWNPGRPAGDPLVRIEKLHALRGKPLSEEQYLRELNVIISAPALATFTDADQLDRLTKVHELHEAGALDDDQVALITARILDAG